MTSIPWAGPARRRRRSAIEIAPVSIYLGECDGFGFTRMKSQAAPFPLQGGMMRQIGVTPPFIPGQSRNTRVSVWVIERPRSPER